jgi:hypothetical protein
MTDAARRMSRVDTAWLRMDNDVNLMMIVGVWLLRPAVTMDMLRERIADKLLKYERFRQKAVIDTIGAVWVDDEHFDIARHVAPKSLHPEPGESPRQALQRTCGDLAMTPLDPAPPPVAVSPGGGLRRRQRHHRAHPPLHRRRHRADQRHAQHHRRWHRPAAGAQEAP